jgi:hypothetical protein
MIPFIKASGLRRRNGHEGELAAESESPSQLIDARIKELGNWRGEISAGSVA